MSKDLIYEISKLTIERLKIEKEREKSENKIDIEKRYFMKKTRQDRMVMHLCKRNVKSKQDKIDEIALHLADSFKRDRRIGKCQTTK